MKKFIAFVLLMVTLSSVLLGCGKKCYTCGKSLNGEGYTAFGNNYCNYCFMYDLGFGEDTDDESSDTDTDSNIESIFDYEKDEDSNNLSNSASDNIIDNNSTTESSNNSTQSHTHKYSYATCTKPATCSCGATKGVALGHSWKAATYTSPKMCSTCGKTEGSSLKIEIKNLTIKSLPFKTKYNIGESFDDYGLVLQLNYTDGSYTEIDNGYQISGFSSSTKGEKTITVSYKEQCTTFTVTVVVENVKLSRVKSFESVDATVEKNIYDSYGNYYDECIHFYAYSSLLENVAVSTYYLNGNYSKFSGTIAYEDYYLDEDWHIDGSFILNIYADDELIYTKDNITKWSKPFQIDLDIKDCDFLKISVVNKSCDGCYLILANAELKV